MKPITTLFMLMSVDGKISTGADDELDVDKDFSNIAGVKEGLHQYYKIESTTDLWSLNTGRVMQKIGINERRDVPDKMAVSFVIIDNKPHLSEAGVKYLCRWTKQLVLVTGNREHPAFQVDCENLSIIFQEKMDLPALFERLADEYKVKRITIQSGGKLNGKLLREKLFDYVDIVVAPILIGGKDTTSLIDGQSIVSSSDLRLLSTLKLINCTVLEDSYLRLQYKVMSSEC